jgi:N-glycosylase/DNA lyase
MDKLIASINQLKNTEIRKEIEARIKEFEEIGEKKTEDVFSELCFCLLTANFQAEKCIRIQKELGKGFSFLPEKQLAEELKKQGHRFPNTRANYISEARACKIDLKNNVMKKSGKDMRQWLVDNVKGLGMKEASHFLRNIGYKDVAIIDFHIADLLEKEGIIQKPKSMNKKIYLEIEKILAEIAEKTNLDLSRLDLYLWYMETGKILK